MLRLITLVLALITLGLIGFDTVQAMRSGTWDPIALGNLWFAIHPDSLQLLQPAVERHLARELWDPYILSALTAPAFVTSGALTLIFAGLRIAFRQRRRKTMLD